MTDVNEQSAPGAANRRLDPLQITRPDSSLLTYYVLLALLSGPFFPIAMLPLYFKYQTLRYRFDESGISMSWGVLFRREIHLTYRWYDIADVLVETAGGGGGQREHHGQTRGAHQGLIEGIDDAPRLRDLLLARLRKSQTAGLGDESAAEPTPPRWTAEHLDALREIRDAARVLVGATDPPAP